MDSIRSHRFKSNMGKIILNKEQKSSQSKGISGKKKTAIWGQMEEKKYLKSGTEEQGIIYPPFFRPEGWESAYQLRILYPTKLPFQNEGRKNNKENYQLNKD